MKCGFDLIENFTSPVVLQDAPATFDGIVLAVIGRVVSQANGDLPLLGKSNYAFQNWVRRLLFSGPLSWLITNVFNFRKSRPDFLPPPLQYIDDEVACDA